MSKKIVYPAAKRNSSPILDVLKNYIPSNATGKFLEIASGTGQHLAFFSKHFPNVTFQPSEFDGSLLESIKAYAEETPNKNMLPPVKIDICTPPNTWPVEGEVDYILNVNMFHISPFKCTLSFFKHGGEILKEGGYMFTYGPYAICCVLEPQSNVDFNASLKSSNPEWGIRDLKDLQTIAKEHNIHLKEIHNLPANNNLIVWIKDSSIIEVEYNLRAVVNDKYVR